MKKQILAIMLLTGCQHSTTPDAQVPPMSKSSAEQTYVTAIDESTRVMVVRNTDRVNRMFSGTLVREKNGNCEEAIFLVDRSLSPAQRPSEERIFEGHLAEIGRPSFLPREWKASKLCENMPEPKTKFTSETIRSDLLLLGPEVELHSNAAWGLEILPFEFKAGAAHAVLSLGDQVGVVLDIRDGTVAGVAHTLTDEGGIHSIFANDDDYRVGRLNHALYLKMAQWNRKREEFRRSHGIDNDLSDPQFGKTATEAYVLQTLTELGVF